MEKILASVEGGDHVSSVQRTKDGWNEILDEYFVANLIIEIVDRPLFFPPAAEFIQSVE